MGLDQSRQGGYQKDMITLAVCGVADVPRFAQSNLTDLVSFGDPDTHPELCKPQSPPDFTLFPNTRIYRFEYQDICHISPTSPSTAHTQRLLDIIDYMIASHDVRVLFHCQAGVARSTAAAFILCVRAGMTYQQAYDHVLKVRGVLNPNILMIKLADELMGHEGRMLGFILTHRWNGEAGNRDALDWANQNGYAFSL